MGRATVSATAVGKHENLLPLFLGQLLAAVVVTTIGASAIGCIEPITNSLLSHAKQPRRASNIPVDTRPDQAHHPRVHTARKRTGQGQHTPDPP